MPTSKKKMQSRRVCYIVPEVWCNRVCSIVYIYSEYSSLFDYTCKYMFEFMKTIIVYMYLQYEMLGITICTIHFCEFTHTCISKMTCTCTCTNTNVHVLCTNTNVHVHVHVHVHVLYNYVHVYTCTMYSIRASRSHMYMYMGMQTFCLPNCTFVGAIVVCFHF